MSNSNSLHVPTQSMPTTTATPISGKPTGLQLGPLVADYRGRPTPRRAVAWLLVLGLASISTPLAYALGLAQETFNRYGPVPARMWSLPWFWLAGLAASLYFLLLVLRFLRSRRFVAVHKNGLRLRLGWLRVRALAWDEIRGVSFSVSQDHFLQRLSRRRYRTILHLQRGRPVYLGDWLVGLPDLVSRIKASLYRRLLPAYQAQLQAGDSLSFGRLSLRQNSLQIGRRQVPWRDIDQILVENGAIVVIYHAKKRQVARSRVPLAKITNPELLLQLVQKGIDT